MDLLKTLLIYMTMVFATSVQSAPEAMDILTATPEPTPYVAAATATPVPTPEPTPVPTIDITPNPAYKTLQMGDRNELVLAMQEKLIEYGYLQGEADGVFGNQTRMAVEAFQYQHGLSSDGIAGRHTLTVLYESPEIRLSPSIGATPEPTATAQLTLALTPAPTAEPTFAPVETVKVQKKQEVIVKATPTPAPRLELEPMTDYDIQVGEEMIKAHPCKAGTMMYLPLAEILEVRDILVLKSSSVDKDEVAFAIGENLIHLAYTEDQQGEPIDLEVYVNTEPQIMPTRDIRRADGSIYLPVSSFAMITGFDTEVDDAAKLVKVSAE